MKEEQISAVEDMVEMREAKDAGSLHLPQRKQQRPRVACSLKAELGIRDPGNQLDASHSSQRWHCTRLSTRLVTSLLNYSKCRM